MTWEDRSQKLLTKLWVYIQTKAKFEKAGLINSGRLIGRGFVLSPGQKYKFKFH